MKHFLTLCLLAVTLCAVAQEQTVKHVTIPQIVDRTGQVPDAIKQMLRTSLTFAVARTSGYECIDMSDNFQDGNQTPKCASYLLIAEVSPFMDGNVMVIATLLDKETAQVINAVPTTIVSTKNLTELAKTFGQMGETLLTPQE